MFGSGYHRYGPRDADAPTEDLPFERSVEWFCLASHTELMVGTWKGWLLVDNVELHFEGEASASVDDSATEMHISETGEVPAQVVRLENGGFRLETAVETTTHGRFEGAIFTARGGLIGDLVNERGESARLTIEPR